MHEAEIKNSPRRITDAQQGIHKNLEQIVKKHLNNLHKKPLSLHTQSAFENIQARVERHLKQNKPLIFDSCCGTAMSTQLIANDYSDALVIGIDRSEVRLAKETNSKLANNIILVQAECADFWKLALDAGWKLQKHFILYPNPYPKSKHLKRRWHGHPAFPDLLALGVCIRGMEFIGYSNNYSIQVIPVNETHCICSCFFDVVCISEFSGSLRICIHGKNNFCVRNRLQTFRMIICNKACSDNGNFDFCHLFIIFRSPIISNNSVLSQFLLPPSQASLQGKNSAKTIFVCSITEG